LNKNSQTSDTCHIYITRNNIKNIIKNSAINTYQGKILGYSTFNSIPKGWQNKTYKLSNDQFLLFVLLNGITGRKNQELIFKDFNNEH